MKYICTLCGAEFDDDGDAMMHVGFGHKLINSIAETDAELSRELRFGN